MSAAKKSRFAGKIRAIGENARSLLKKVSADEALDPKAAGYLEKITQASKKLVDFAETEIDAIGFGEVKDDPGDRYRILRHDVRNRLNHLSGPCQLLQRKLKDSELAFDAAELRAQIEGCLAVIDGYGTTDGPLLEPLETSEVATRGTADVEPARILVAEDEAENRDFLNDVLTSEGHTVEQAVDGAEALAGIRRGKVDLALLDLGLPKMSGYEVLEELESSGLLRKTPVIVVTGRRGVEDAVRCIDLGAEDFLSKPVHIDLLRARVNSCLEKKRLREQELRQILPEELVREYGADLAHLPARHAEVSVLFADLRSFSAISERLGPERTTGWLRHVMDELTECIRDHGGVLVDYAGDEVMAMWGAPKEMPDHAERACDTALAMLELLPTIDERWEEKIGRTTNLGIGVNSGRAMVGNIGTMRRLKYGPLGNTVNLGSRVQGATKHLHTDVLITGATRQRLGSSWKGGVFRRLCKVRVNNINEPVELYELAPKKQPGWVKLRTRYEKALTHFEANELEAASAALGKLLADDPADGPSLVLLSRVGAEILARSEEIDPVWTLPGK